MKDFDGWSEKKKKLDTKEIYVHPREREIWWCNIGLNVGREIFGKGVDFLRPVLVVKSRNDELFVGIPLSNKFKISHSSILITDDHKITHNALVFQIRSFDKRRLKSKISKISVEEYYLVEQKFKVILNIK